ncbi:hypothetical protein F01_320007 [Burkholderia cenocepacia]|nr:hypothetical protein F01_320007 [Burkholderia cenocepacia]
MNHFVPLGTHTQFRELRLFARL